MNKKEFFSRKGIIRIKRDLIKSSPELIKEMQGRMLVLDADYNFVQDVVTFWGCSEKFEPIPETEMTPEYKAIFENNHFIKFEKKGGK